METITDDIDRQFCAPHRIARCTACDVDFMATNQTAEIAAGMPLSSTLNVVKTGPQIYDEHNLLKAGVQFLRQDMNDDTSHAYHDLEGACNSIERRIDDLNARCASEPFEHP